MNNVKLEVWYLPSDKVRMPVMSHHVWGIPVKKIQHKVRFNIELNLLNFIKSKVYEEFKT